MDNSGIGEKEYKLLSQVSKDPTGTQREISRQLGFSLGMTNILLKRLIHKGYIKISQLNRRKVKYFLTPRGIAQKIKRTHQYLSYTFHSLKEIKYKVQTVLLAEYKKGRRRFIILGDGELAEITEIALRNLGKNDITYSKSPPPLRGRIEEGGRNSLLLITDSKQKIINNNFSLNLLDAIANFQNG